MTSVRKPSPAPSSKVRAPAPKIPPAGPAIAPVRGVSLTTGNTRAQRVNDTTAPQRPSYGYTGPKPAVPAAAPSAAGPGPAVPVVTTRGRAR